MAVVGVDVDAQNIKPEWTLESRVAQAALRYFGHVARDERGWRMMPVNIGVMNGKRQHIRAFR